MDISFAHQLTFEPDGSGFDPQLDHVDSKSHYDNFMGSGLYMPNHM